MNCVTHPATQANAYCRTCGRAMCDECKRDVHGTIYCENCLAHDLRATAPPVMPTGPIPGLAFGLGFIPGVGAIYNGQFAKAFVHVVIFGLLISILDSGQAHEFEPLFGMMLAAFIFYMAFEALQTAQKRARGEQVDEWSGLMKPGTVASRAGGAIILIAMGGLFLANNFGFFSLHQILRFWPLLLIAAGVSMLVNRVGGDAQGGQ